nr:hypothetical protein [Acidiphilium sp. 37-64-53]
MIAFERDHIVSMQPLEQATHGFDGEPKMIRNADPVRRNADKAIALMQRGLAIKARQKKHDLLPGVVSGQREGSSLCQAKFIGEFAEKTPLDGWMPAEQRFQCLDR